MREERMAVLKMLEKGSIDVDEAERLLRLFQEEKPLHMHGKGRGRNRKDGFEEPPEREKRDFDLEETAEQVSKRFNLFARKVGDKVEEVTAEVEPKFRKAAQTVADKTQEVAQDIRKSFDEFREDWAESEGYRHCDEPVNEDDFEDIVDGSIIDFSEPATTEEDITATTEPEKKDE